MQSHVPTVVKVYPVITAVLSARAVGLPIGNAAIAVFW
jgi:hypothetical protein